MKLLLVFIYIRETIFCYDKYKICNQKCSYLEKIALTATLNLAATYCRQGQLRTSANLEEKVLQARTHFLGEEHSKTLIAHCITYRNQRKFNDSIKLFENAAETRNRISGTEHSDTLWTMSLLGTPYQMYGRLRDSLKLHEKVAEMRKRICGERHSVTSIGLKDMQSLHRTKSIFSKYLFILNTS